MHEKEVFQYSRQYRSKSILITLVVGSLSLPTRQMRHKSGRVGDASFMYLIQSIDFVHTGMRANNAQVSQKNPVLVIRVYLNRESCQMNKSVLDLATWSSEK